MSNQTSITNVHLTEYLYSKASRRRIPLSGTFELTPVCNFACRMCYVRKTPKEVSQSKRKQLTLSKWREIAKQAAEAGTLYLLLTGGEPFIWPDFWTLYEELIDMGMLVSINTNGSLIDEKTVEKLKQRPPRRINITLYGASDASYERLCGVSGVFQKVDSAIRMLKEAGIPLKLNCSLTPHNISDLEAMVEYAKCLDLVFSPTAYMFPPVRRDPSLVGVNDRFTPEETAKFRLRCYELQHDSKAYRSYLQSICDGSVEPPGLEEGCVDPVDGRIRCRAGNASFWITWDGWMTPCGMMPEPKLDLTQIDFASSWMELVQISDHLRLTGVCSNCPNQKLCHPCAAMAAAETGSVSGIPKYLCEMSREMRRIALETLSPSQ